MVYLAIRLEISASIYDDFDEPASKILERFNKPHSQTYRKKVNQQLKQQNKRSLFIGLYNFVVL